MMQMTRRGSLSQAGSPWRSYLHSLASGNSLPRWKIEGLPGVMRFLIGLESVWIGLDRIG